MEAEAVNNKVAHDILADLIKKGHAVQDADGNVSVPSASKVKNPSN